MYRLSEIVKRYNDSVSDYVAYLVAKNEHEKDAQDMHLRNAGEGLSQVLEQALKLHAKTNSPDLFSRHALDSTPTIINTFYLDKTGKQKSLYDATVDASHTILVDFNYMRTNKRLLTNYSKHEGGNVDPVVVEEYMKQCKLFITEYLDKKALLREPSYFMDAQQDYIQQFYVACDHFQREDRTFILLSDRIDGVDEHYYSHFANAPWDIIVDFYQLSSENGLSAGAYHGGGDVPHIYKPSDIVTTEEITASLRKPLYFYANGFKGERCCTCFKDWNRTYHRKLELFLEAVSRSKTTQKTIVVSLLQDEEYIESIQLLINRYFTNVKFVIANDPNDILLPLSQRKSDTYEHVRTTIEEINKCINEYLIVGDTETKNETFSVPYVHGEGNGVLSLAELQDLQECFEVLYSKIGEGTEDEIETYLRGESELTWQGVKRNFAAKRERYQKMYVKPLETIIKNGRNKIFIMHEPGYGGSTVARQLAYDFRESYPVLFLREYRYTAVTQKLAWLHERTRKTIVVFMEVPSVISADDFDYLYRSANQSRPYVLIGIMRGVTNNIGNINVTDWGKDAVLLSEKYKPIIEARYSGGEKTAKLNEIQNILTGTSNEAYKRTPFYFGMLTYEKDFVAADGFYEKFVTAVADKEKHRKFLIYLALCDVYADKALPEIFFKTVFGVEDRHIFKLENYFSESDGILKSLVQIDTVGGNVRNIRLKYPFFSETLLKKLLRRINAPEDTGWLDNLGIYCKDFIEEAAHSDVADYLENDLIQPMFIGSSKERDGDHFTRLVEAIRKEDRINVFVALHDQFPDNPHFCSHLARFYSLEEKNMEKALEYADRAIRLSPNDPLLHHMKGMCFFYIIGERIETVKRNFKANLHPTQEELSYITENLLSQAEAEFQKSREIQQRAHHDDEYGYIPNIKLLLRVFDFYVMITGETKRHVISTAKDPYITWLDKAHTLLEDARRMHEEGEESEHFLTCESNLWQEYEDYGVLLEKLNNQLTQTKHPALIRRQIAQIYMKRDEEYKSNPKVNERILALMNDNMRSDGASIVNFLLWFKAARYSSLTTDDILSRLTQWSVACPAMDLSFYTFVFNVIKAIDGSSEAAERARKALQECQKLGGNNRIGIKEWYGDAPQGIVSNYERTNRPGDFNLYEVYGYVKDYQHPGNAIIQLDCGLEVFFKPSVNGIFSSSLNHRVRFFLGFSYDGLRADSESVELIG